MLTRKLLLGLSATMWLFNFSAQAEQFNNCPDDPSGLYKPTDNIQRVYWIIPFKDGKNVNDRKTATNLITVYAPANKPRFVCESGNCITSDGKKFGGYTDRYAVIPDRSGSLKKVTLREFIHWSDFRSLHQGVSCKYKYKWEFYISEMFSFEDKARLPYLLLQKIEEKIDVKKINSNTYKF